MSVLDSTVDFGSTRLGSIPRLGTLCILLNTKIFRMNGRCEATIRPLKPHMHVGKTINFTAHIWCAEYEKHQTSILD